MQERTRSVIDRVWPRIEGFIEITRGCASGACMGCARCCAIIPCDDPDNIPPRWILLDEVEVALRGFARLIQPGRRFFTCSALGDDLRCTMYDTRPEHCRNFPANSIGRPGFGVYKGCGYEDKTTGGTSCP